MQETQLWFLGPEDPLEKEEATRSCISAWEILWTEETTVHRLAKSWTQLSHCTHMQVYTHAQSILLSICLSFYYLSHDLTSASWNLWCNSAWVQRPENQEFQGQKTDLSAEAITEEGVHSVQAFSALDDVHKHCGGQTTSLSLSLKCSLHLETLPDT